MCLEASIGLLMLTFVLSSQMTFSGGEIEKLSGSARRCSLMRPKYVLGRRSLLLSVDVHVESWTVAKTRKRMPSPQPDNLSADRGGNLEYLTSLTSRQ